MSNLSNLDTLIEAGLVPTDNTLTDDDKQIIESLSQDEVQSLISLKTKLGDDFILRNTRYAPNCIF
jgi:hypothetical protein